MCNVVKDERNRMILENMYSALVITLFIVILFEITLIKLYVNVNRLSLDFYSRIDACHLVQLMRAISKYHFQI